MRILLITVAASFISTSAFAQVIPQQEAQPSIPQPTQQQQVDGLEQRLIGEWSSLQLSHQHLMEAVNALVSDRRNVQKQLDTTQSQMRIIRKEQEETQKYWAEYIKGLSP